MNTNISAQQLAEQEFKINFYNKFSGYDYSHEGNNIHVWKTIVCLECLEPLMINHCVIPAAAPEFLQARGLNLWVGERPKMARATYAGGPLLCEHHHAGWLCNKPLPHVCNLLGDYPAHG